MNSRMDAFQAAVLRVKLGRLDEWNDERRRLASRYTRVLRDLFPASAGAAALPDDETPVVPPPPAGGDEPIYHLYVIRALRRQDLMAHLKQRGVGCAVYYPTPLHLQRCFSSLGYRGGAFPSAERAAAEVLALPIFPGLRDAEQDEVCEAVASFYGVKV